jgi:hypothetical protein
MMTMSETYSGDKEIEAMGAVNQALAGLDRESAVRILKWAADRYGVDVSARFHPGTRDSLDAPIRAAPNQNQMSHSDVAEIYAAAEPATDAERALVVGYWLQRTGSSENLAAQDINKELKHLGHGVSNVTVALNGLIQQKPQLVIQVRKSGTTKQARKLYRLTAAGIGKVEEMIARSQSES